MPTSPDIEKRTVESATRLGQTHDVEALYILLGKQQQVIEENPALAADPTLDPPYDSTHMGLVDDLRDLGLSIAALWARKLHGVVCGEEASAEDRQKLLSALNVSEAAAISVVASLLLPMVSPAIAAPIAVIVVKQFLVPAGGLICEHWGRMLKDMPA